MRFTREQIRAMDGATLRVNVLIPLLKKMGFQDVSHHHGGSGEKGKDIVMWKIGSLGERLNCAVVVKAGRISGKAEVSSGSAGGVVMQIQQSFGCPFLGAITGEQQLVNECWVVSSKEISKDARESILSALRTSNLDRLTKFVDGERLWELIETHFPICATLEHYRLVRDACDNMHPDFRMAIDSRGGRNKFILEPKPHATARHGEDLNFRIQFGLDEKSLAKAAEVNSAIEKGLPVVVEANHLSKIEVPEFIRSFLGEVAKIEFCSGVDIKDLAVNSDDGTRSAKGDFVLRPKRAGTRELLLSTEHQKLPFSFEILIDKTQPTPNLQVQFQPGGNVHRLLEAAKLTNVLAVPGEISIVVAETGRTWVRARTELVQPIVQPFHPQLVEYLEDLDVIQKATDKDLFLSPGKVDRHDMIHVRWLATLVRQGYSTKKGLSVTTSFGCSDAEQILWRIENEKGFWNLLCGDRIERICNKDVSLGPMALRFSDVSIPRECVTTVRSAVQRKRRGNVKLTFECAADSEVECYLLNRLPPNFELPEDLRQVLERQNVTTPRQN
jgi:hypothetical protein